MRLYATLPVLFLVSSAVLPVQVLSAPTQETQALARADLSERATFGPLVSSLLKYLNLGSLMNAFSHVVPGAAREFVPDRATGQTPGSLAPALSGPMGSKFIQSISGRDEYTVEELVATLNQLNLRDSEVAPPSISRRDDISVEDLVTVWNRLNQRDSEVAPVDFGKVLKLFGRMLDELD
ncbi:hypothetical protein BC827DRAFT_1184629 [Russula dissimulans]|nr:hypothetical protein BC827DRAFT_1184629 [Russula dissimulans]